MVIATIPADNANIPMAMLRRLWPLEFPSKAAIRARNRRAKVKIDHDHAVAGSLARLGDGLRPEEIAAATGLCEDDVRKSLRRQAKLGWLVDLGERGWWRAQEAEDAGLVPTK